MKRATSRGVISILFALVGSACAATRPAEVLDQRAILYRLRSVDADVKGGEGLSADASAALALFRSPELAAKRIERKIAASAIASAQALENPELRLGLRELLTGNPLQLAAALRIFPPLPGETEAKLERAKAEEAEVQAELEGLEAEVVARTLTAHAELLALEEKAVIHRAAIALHAELVALVERRVNGGAATRLDLVLARLKQDGVEEKMAALDLERAAARSKLAGLLGLSDLPVTLDPTTHTSSEAKVRLELDPRALEDLALDARADLRALRKSWDGRDARVRLRLAQAGPRVKFLEPGVSRLGDTPRLELSAAVELPLFDDGHLAIEVAAAERDRVLALLAARVQSIRTELRSALAQLAAAKAREARHTKEIAPRLEEAEALVAESLASRAVDPLALEAVSTRLLDAKVAAIDARLARRRAEITLARATGTILDALP